MLMPEFLNRRFGPSIFWAGFVGFLIGILFSITVWSTNSIVQMRSSTPDEAGSINQTGSHLIINVTSPISGAVVRSDTITISGTTSAPTVVVISGGNADTVVDSGSNKFSTTYKLKEGENEVTVTAVDSAGDENSSILNVLYSKEIQQ
jgi:Glucodextranase, domain B